MISLRETMRGGREIEQSRPWPRHVVDHTSWLRAIREISKGQGDMLGLWSNGADVHMLLLDHGSSDIGIVSLECPNGRFPSVAHMHPPALRLERAIRDIYELEADGSSDVRPWLDHGRWGVRHPGAKPEPSEASGDAYPSSPRKARRSIKSRWGPCTPALSSPAISVFQRMGKSSSASRNGSVTSIRA